MEEEGRDVTIPKSAQGTIGLQDEQIMTEKEISSINVESASLIIEEKRVIVEGDEPVEMPTHDLPEEKQKNATFDFFDYVFVRKQLRPEAMVSFPKVPT